MFKLWGAVISFFKSHSTVIEDETVHYLSESDKKVIVSQHILALKPLEQAGITQAAFYKGSLYIKQPLKQKSRAQRLQNLLSPQNKLQTNEERLQAIVSYLVSDPIVQTFLIPQPAVVQQLPPVNPI